jgi:hypothetical protein
MAKALPSPHGTLGGCHNLPPKKGLSGLFKVPIHNTLEGNKKLNPFVMGRKIQ